MKNIVISCKSKEEYFDVLEKLEKRKCRWASGDMPTCELGKSYWMRAKIKELCVHNNTITTYRVGKDYKEITASEFIGNKPIIIHKDGRNVVALDKNTGKSGIAKCHPDDEFDFYTGAKLAFSRLTGCKLVEFDGEPKSDTSEDADTAKFNVGDTVKVKSGLKVDGIYYGSSSPLAFLRTMKTNEPIKIESISPSGNYYCSNGYYYTPEMIEKYNEFVADKFKVGDKVALNINTIIGNKYDGITLLEDMACFGVVLTVREIRRHDSGRISYRCDNGYIYSGEMLDSADDAIIIGSKIKVVNDGFTYDTYWQWVDENVKKPRDKIRYAFQSSPENGYIGKVIAIAPHINGEEKNLIYFECEDNNCYLIGSDGVKKYNE